MKKVFLYILTSIFLSCNNYSKKDSHLESFSNASSIQDSGIIGVWRLKNETNAVFKIIEDSIYYIDENQVVYYTIKKDSMFIYYESFVDSNSFKVINNELILNSTLSKDTFVRQN
mgnify:CR=1 FL=1